MHFDNDEDFFYYLLEIGAIEKVGYNENNVPLYRLNIDVFKTELPEIFETVQAEIDKDLVNLYQMGLIDISYDENLNAKFSISEKGKRYVKTGELDSYIRDDD